MKKWMAVAVAVLLSAAPSVTAHEGHDHGAEGQTSKIMGTVSAVHADKNHIEVKATDGKTVGVPLDANTKFHRGKAAAKLADIQVGDRVVVTMTAGAAASEVRLSEKKKADAPKKP